MKSAPTWDVVATVKAEAAQIMAFCNHHLALGASRIFIFLDDPSFYFAPSNPRISCHGPNLEDRPDGIEERQRKNATLAARISQSDWILHCDVDEYLDSTEPMEAILSTVPPNIGSILVAPIEPLYESFPQNLSDILASRYFRVKNGSTEARLFWQKLHGELYPLSSHGFWAHRRGKSLYRTSLARMGRNIPLHGFNGERAKRLGQIELLKVTLRHFDALSFEQWLEKHLARAEGIVHAPEAGGKRMALAQLVQQAHSQGTARALFERMMTLDAEALKEGLAKGYIKQRNPLHVT